MKTTPADLMMGTGRRFYTPAPVDSQQYYDMHESTGEGIVSSGEVEDYTECDESITELQEALVECSNARVELEQENEDLQEENETLGEAITGGGSCAAYYRHGSYYSFNGVICVAFDGVSTAVCTINSTCISWPSGGGGAGGNATFRGSFYDASGGALGSTSAQLTAAFDFTSTGVITTESSSTITESVPSGAVRVEWHQPSPPYTRFATVYI